MISKLTFGSKKRTVHYVLRPSCYAVIFHSSSSMIAVIQKGDRYFYLVAVWKVMKQRRMLAP